MGNFLKKTVVGKPEPMKLLTRKKTQVLSNNHVVSWVREEKAYNIHRKRKGEIASCLKTNSPRSIECLSKTKANFRLWRIPGAGWLAAKVRHIGKLWAWLKILLQKLRQKGYHRFLITLASTHSQMHMCSHTYGSAYITDTHVHEKTKKVGKMFLFRPTNAG